MVSVCSTFRGRLRRLRATQRGAEGECETPSLVAEAGASGSTISLAVATALGLAYENTLQAYEADPEFVARVPIGFARRYGILGLVDKGGCSLVALSSLDSIDQFEATRRLLGRLPRPIVAPPEAIAAATNQAYQRKEVEVDSILEDIDKEDVLSQIEAIHERADLLDSGRLAPVIKLVNLILFEAVKQRASDVHIQPYEDRVVVRIRVDGLLSNAFEFPKPLQEEMTSRVKVMGRMDIAEKRLPQDGRATVQVGDRVIDLRIASLPTAFGERLVIRLLDKSRELYRLDDLGMDQAMLARFRRQIGMEHGLILVTGPTGSGKTTTLYAAMLQLDVLGNNIITLEDPIEYQLPGVSQTQVSLRKGMTFAGGLRSVLRQDPDIIMVGEIRDHETATITIQSALTGHLVFSTLHTNDAASAITRLLDLGIEPYLVASSVIGVLAQRLVRRVCPECGQPYELTESDWIRLQQTPVQQPSLAARRGRGCGACRQTGYRGRVGLFELLCVDDRVRQLISSRAAAMDMRACAVRGGMRTLMDDGLTKIAAGITTSDEVSRVVSTGGE